MAFGNLFRNTSTTMGRWYFPSGRNLEKTSASNAYVETFNDKKSNPWQEKFVKTL